MINEKPTIIIDSDGGITVKIDDWARTYSNFEEYAERVKKDIDCYLNTGNNDGWYKYERDPLELKPSYRVAYHNGCRVLY